MNERETSTSPTDSGGGGVLDPRWEEELRRGQEAEGEAGSVEPELEMVHLLRHSREPESISADELDAIWSAIEAEVAPEATPWWRKAWVWWTAPALAATAVLAVVILDPAGRSGDKVARSEAPAAEAQDSEADRAAGQAREDAPLSEGRGAAAPSAAEAEPGEQAADKNAARAGGGTIADGTMGVAATRSSNARAFESSFARLAPQGRVAIRVGVEHSRDELREQLLAKARGGG